MAAASIAVPEQEASSLPRDEANGATCRGAPGHGEGPRAAAVVAGADFV
ncbi:hypothetical protein J8J14_13640 [Roseomonas sp. SSH11]|uniref:Uncharacterized protein n=1 Tax=Pararoseomonas baculiformis TaxID=2820812 RepID=A0ABS4AFP3_9PROT|nr:hypothetical protein [Pararoseomonas baculiformis]MBP0445818.1 hypothetical protein [Pararoseomonas baculiformis]